MLIGALGAQALMAGLFAAYAMFTRHMFLACGIALSPFCRVDYFFYAAEPMLTEIGLLDAFRRCAWR